MCFGPSQECDGGFLRKQLTAKSHQLLLQKSSFIDVSLVPKYASADFASPQKNIMHFSKKYP